MSSRIEILSNGSWVKIRLKNSTSIQYNALINRIGDTSGREISHTNTFEIPSTSENIIAFGLNIFNHQEMSRVLNQKFNAKYFIDDQLLQIGFIIINNVQNGIINVNFIDESLDIVEKWGTTTYYDLITGGINIPADYQIAIDEMKDYVMDKVNILATLSDVGIRGHKVALFPNSLNVIGDKFNKDVNNLRPIDSFNPYQSRPIFNVKALFDLAAEAFGYTSIYDSSVDWTIIEKTYIVASGLNDNKDDSGGLETIVYPSILFEDAYYIAEDGNSTVNTAYVYSNSRAYALDQIIEIQNITPPITDWFSGWESKKNVYKPIIEESFLGTIRFQAQISDTANNAIGLLEVYSVWHSTISSGVVYKLVPQAIDNGGGLIIDVTINKGNLDPSNKPANAGAFIGVITIVRAIFGNTSSDMTLINIVTSETYIPTGLVSFDEEGQYVANNIDLTFAAPRESIKDLLSSCMQKEGILLSFDNEAKTIKFFSYGQYGDRKYKEEVNDWSDKFIKTSLVNRNTNYGDNYAKINQVGLKGPFLGNSTLVQITNQGTESKHKDKTTDFNKKFKDVTKVVKLLHPTTPYQEYSNSGLGLIEQNGNLGILTQRRFDGTPQGTFTGLAHIANVNYAILPSGVDEWYKIIDTALRIDGSFYIQVFDIKKIDLSIPIYISELGGFFIIEEISEYINSVTPVIIKLIKLIDELGDSSLTPPTPDIIPPTIGILSEGTVGFTESQIPLTWTTASDNIGVTGYRIYQNNVISVFVGNITSYIMTGLTFGQNYTFEIEARDAAGNWSSKSNTIISTPKDGEAPIIGVLTLDSTTQNSATISWTAATDNIGVTGYEVYKNNIFVANVGNVLSGSLTGLSEGSSYDIYIKAIDAQSNSSLPSNTVTANILDVTAPIIGPLILGSVTATEINISWFAASDNVGVTGYKVYRNGSLIATLSNVLSYKSTGLAAGSTHLFKIKALDLAGNESVFSNEISGTTDSGVAVTALGVSNGYSLLFQACDSFESTTRYTTGNFFVQVGDVFYTDNPGVTPLVGNDQYFRIPSSNNYARINNNGIVTEAGGGCNN